MREAEGISRIVLLVIFSSIFIISGCNESKSNDNNPSDTTTSDCCQECLDYANRDPSGYDISIKPCSEYGLACEQSVGDCREE